MAEESKGEMDWLEDLYTSLQCLKHILIDTSKAMYEYLMEYWDRIPTETKGFQSYLDVAEFHLNSSDLELALLPQTLSSAIRSLRSLSIALLAALIAEDYTIKEFTRASGRYYTNPTPYRSILGQALDSATSIYRILLTHPPPSTIETMAERDKEDLKEIERIISDAKTSAWTKPPAPSPPTTYKSIETGKVSQTKGEILILHWILIPSICYRT